MGIYVHDKPTKSFNPVALPIMTTLAVAEGPYPTYWRSARPTVTKTTVTLPAPLHVMINGKSYTTNADVTLNVSSVGNAIARAAKDVYIYAVEPTTGIVPEFVLSLNSTTPSGYTADNSRKIGGFHCLCADVGTITGHTLSGYVAGDILPASIWDLLHRPKSEPEGMVYSEQLDRWFDIYLASYDGSQLRSAYGVACADGISSPNFHGEKFNEEFAKVKKRLIDRDDFVVVAWGSNNGTNIAGSADAGTTGGHVDTANRRMISNIGLEDCCGFMWQWTNQLYGKPYYGDAENGYGSQNVTVGWTARPRYNHDGITGEDGIVTYSGNNVYHSLIDPEPYGDDYGVLYRLRAGGDWSDSSHCGPRAVHLSHVAANRDAYHGGRGASEPRTRFV